MPSKSLLERFNQKYSPEPNSGCWLWTGSVEIHGYGRIANNKKIYLAHRISYSLFKGFIGDKFVLHHCDNPPCVNPDHLFLGTQLDNIKDRNSKNRQGRGEKISSKLTEKDILKIRALKGKLTQVQIAKKFSLSVGHVHLILKKRSWRHIP